MIDSFELQGLWWLPDRPRKKICGTLSFSQEKGGHLSLEGGFVDKTIEVLRKLDYEGHEPELILGESNKGERITLWKCFLLPYSLNYMLSNKSIYHIDLIFRNAHFKSSSELKFINLKAHFSNIEEWVGITGLSTNIQSIDSITINYNKPKNLNFDATDELIVRFLFNPGFSRNIYKEIKINEEIWVDVTSKKKNEKKDFEQLWKILSNMNSLLTFALNQKTYILHINGYKNRTNHTPCEVIYQQVQTPEKNYELSFSKILLTFADFSTNLENTVFKWNFVSTNFSIVVSLYNLLYSKDRLFIENKFLSIIQAIEAYHTKKYGINEIPNEEFLQKVQKITNSIDDQNLKIWTEGKLKYSNQIALNQRLNDLFKPYLSPFNGNIKNIKSFIHKVVKVRNDISHGNEKRSYFKDSKSFYYVIQILKILLECHFLNELGFTEDFIKMKASKSLSELNKDRKSVV
jgi:hypothetical protein